MTGDVQVPDGGGDVEAVLADLDNFEWQEVCYDDRDAGYAHGYETGLVDAARRIRAALASQPAPTVTDEAVEAGLRYWLLGAGWDEEDIEANVDDVKACRREVEGILTAALPHMTPAQSGDGVAEVRPEGAPLTPELGQTIAEYWEAKVGEAVARERERIATALEVERDRPWSIAETMNTSIYGALDIAVHIARTTTEEADHG